MMGFEETCLHNHGSPMVGHTDAGMLIFTS